MTTREELKMTFATNPRRKMFIPYCGKLYVTKGSDNDYLWRFYTIKGLFWYFPALAIRRIRKSKRCLTRRFW